jgi:hypothetical protein
MGLWSACVGASLTINFVRQRILIGDLEKHGKQQLAVTTRYSGSKDEELYL